MSVPAPHFLLYPTARNDRPPHEPAAGQWRFVLTASDGSSQLEASDEEPEISRDRLELLAIVRGLEALDQPSSVIVVTASRYISRGVRFGLPSWRENGWQWERFGQFVPVKNADLWRRIENAMQFHQVSCRYVEAVRPSPQLQVQQAVAPPLASRTKPRRSLWAGAKQLAGACAGSLAMLWPKPHLRSAAC